MTQEAQLERINLNLEKLISILSLSSNAPAIPPDSQSSIAAGEAAVAAAGAAATGTAEPPKRGRGRPVKGEAAPVTPAAAAAPVAAPTVQEAADFLSLETPEVVPTKVVTLDEVRAALAVYQTKNDQGKAVALFKEHGKTETLQQLKPENYAAVFKAALPAEKFTVTDVREVLVAAEGRVKGGGQDAMKKVGGVSSIQGLTDDKFVAVIIAAALVR